ncbi:Gfo/Idh/MocA family protein [Galbibacter pacificus]|uniref:Gfo/Idh/MocA family oxidoreductase n=1 Tax=Galbibacter pacificus TaxID=2996052 RepID=A0ABT6FUM6_9FLAO|nr:Gfo/Idh/MocA family oxidoreductase [Galbibacter pacificus]MDG3583560.1 Gfo/Idh/MocA family oxidoreductase [Galbibacter pacificus]MDG3586964.1 Gfo/Idh/MocA family oxidoreductase [Galbibacter pacificus]
MNDNRRNFLKLGSLAGLGLASGSALAACETKSEKNSVAATLASAQNNKQIFNMSGYRAPKIETVRIGFIGLGMRGPHAVQRMSYIDGVEIKGLCDIRQKQVDNAQKILEGTKHSPDTYVGDDNEWKKMCDRDDIDLIYIATPWEWHTPMAVYAMEAGKHVAVEVPAAKTIDECWQLVETSEKTKKHCMMLENCCYDFFELLTLNMARQGFFGEIIHGEGAYIHNLLDLNFNKETGYESMWRLKENAKRNGNLYPTHGLGPICQIMDINRGDQMDYLTSLSSNDFNMHQKAVELAKEDNFYQEYTDVQFRGNMNTTLVKTKKGHSIMIQHDVSSPRPYSRIHLVSGSKGMARKWPSPARIAKGHSWMNEEEMKEIETQYTPEIVKKVGDLAKQVGGHGGMDFIMDWRLIDCLRNGLALDQNVYDAALWSSIAPLSEKSVANRSQSIDVPDFTIGSWKTNAPVDITLAGGGTTNVILNNK